MGEQYYVPFEYFPSRQWSHTYGKQHRRGLAPLVNDNIVILCFPRHLGKKHSAKTKTELKTRGRHHHYRTGCGKSINDIHLSSQTRASEEGWTYRAKAANLSLVACLHARFRSSPNWVCHRLLLRPGCSRRASCATQPTLGNRVGCRVSSPQNTASKRLDSRLKAALPPKSTVLPSALYRGYTFARGRKLASHVSLLPRKTCYADNAYRPATNDPEALMTYPSENMKPNPAAQMRREFNSGFSATILSANAWIQVVSSPTVIGKRNLSSWFSTRMYSINPPQSPPFPPPLTPCFPSQYPPPWVSGSCGTRLMGMTIRQQPPGAPLVSSGRSWDASPRPLLLKEYYPQRSPLLPRLAIVVVAAVVVPLLLLLLRLLLLCRLATTRRFVHVDENARAIWRSSPCSPTTIVTMIFFCSPSQKRQQQQKQQTQAIRRSKSSGPAMATFVIGGCGIQ